MGDFGISEEKGMEVYEGNVVKGMEAMDIDLSSKSAKILDLLRRFLGVQQRRAKAYARWHRGFSEYMAHGGDLAYQKLCADITTEFNDCSKQASYSVTSFLSVYLLSQPSFLVDNIDGKDVLEMESLFLMPDISRNDLACLLKDVQAEEKQKLHLTAKIQILKKAGRPSERLVSHEHCRFSDTAKHECLHVREITEEDGTEDAEADAEYDSSLKEAIRGVQDAVTSINEHLEEVRYEIEALSPTITSVVL
ncbi:hypothetical protein IEQ34_016733 [Dendrobium chrysotoxum]|uniref:Uncharacterized protein n=1 Tax=Dendrobium chrysotoxum TaxID=161865 RepID=A0AAV7GFY1_DENCH|nr:hypothetical protein IEQ34_016733 [Dendrobium chrysotoxum]